MLLNNRLYSKSFVGSLTVHLILLVFFVLSFQTTIHSLKHSSLSGEHPADIVEAVVIEKKNPPMPTRTSLRAAPVPQRDRKEQVLEDAKLERLKQDMAQAKKDIKKEVQALTAIKEENQAEQQRLKEAQHVRVQEEKKREVLKQKAAAAAQARLQAQKLQVAKEKALQAAATEKARIVAEKARIAAHQKQVATEIQQVVGRWRDKIESNRRFMIEGMPAHLSCRVALQVLPDGSVRVSLVQSSGHAVYDDLSIKAIYKSEPFELPDNPEVRQQVKDIEINFLNDGGV